MRFIYLLLLLLCTTITPLASQPKIPGRVPLQVDFDIARFYGDSAKTYVELYYGIRENMLGYVPDSGRLVGTVNFLWEIRGDSAVVLKKEWSVPHVMNDSTHLANAQTLMGIESAGLVPGNYTMTLVAYDLLDPSRRDSTTVPILINKFWTDHEALSDVEFCTSIQSSTDKQSRFYKNTLEVIPNASKLYGIGLPIMYYYTEAYNLNANTSNANVIVHTSIIDAMGTPVMEKEKAKPRSHQASVEIGTMNLSALRGGTYIFRETLLDSSKRELASTSKKFFVYKPSSGRDSTLALGSGMDVSRSEYAFMNESDLDRMFSQAVYIASQGEREQYEKLTDVQAKRNFLFDFWRRRDVDPSTPINESKIEYYKRVEYANEHYAHALRPGWKTDEGRVYIIYGAPDEVERFPSSSESNPYEIWHFNNIQGGVIFVFVDRNGLGDYLLVHSTHRNELQNENWYQQYAQKSN